MCDCIQEIEKRVKEEFAPKYPGVKSIGFSNKAFDGRGTILSQPIDIEYTRTTKSGREQNKTVTIRVTPSYCPFCGEKLEGGPADDI